MEESNTIKCRNCEKTNLKIYEDGSGFCPDCNDTFADVNKYEQNKKEIIGSTDNFFAKNNNQQVVKKWKNLFKDESLLTNLYFLFGLVFCVISIRLIIMFGIGEPSDIILLVCGILFFISGFNQYDNEYKRAFYISIIIVILLLVVGIYEYYIGVIVDYTCLCPISFLLFIVISSFIFLRIDKTNKK